MAKYDFNMDVEESWMENVAFDQLNNSDKEMLNMLCTSTMKNRKSAFTA